MASTLATGSSWGPGRRGGVRGRGLRWLLCVCGGGGAPWAPACNPHHGPGTQCQQSPGANGTEHPPGRELVPPALHSGTRWVMVAHGVGLARPQHCVQLPAGSPCPPPCLAPGKTLLTCASADLLLWWREGATRGMWPWRLQAISEAREAKPASERESGGQGTARVTPPFGPAPLPRSWPRLQQALGRPSPCTAGLDC